MLIALFANCRICWSCSSEPKNLIRDSSGISGTQQLTRAALAHSARLSEHQPRQPASVSWPSGGPTRPPVERGAGLVPLDAGDGAVLARGRWCVFAQRSQTGGGSRLRCRPASYPPFRLEPTATARAPGGSRTHTEPVLSRFPLPVGVRGPGPRVGPGLHQISTWPRRLLQGAVPTLHEWTRCGRASW